MTDTPHIDAAIREACSPWHDEPCNYPACDCAPVVPDMIKTALRAAIPREPPAEMLNQMREALFWGSIYHGYNEETIDRERERMRGIQTREVERVYRAQPIYRELWPDDTGRG